MESAMGIGKARGIGLAAIAAIALAGCANTDRFGNHVPPMDVPTHFTYDPVVSFEAQNVDDLQDWCRAQKGTLTGDGRGCIVSTDYVIDKNWPCYEAMDRHLDGEHRDSTRRELDAICNGWIP